MADIIDLKAKKAEREPHIAGAAFCVACDHTWTGVWPIGTTEFQCPECKRLMGRSTYEISPHKDAKVFECNCGNQLYHVLTDRIHCPSCGQQTSFADLAEQLG